MSENIIKIGGVPEHFNLPWHFLLEKTIQNFTIYAFTMERL